jgi:hypothetical protein
MGRCGWLCHPVVCRWIYCGHVLGWRQLALLDLLGRCFIIATVWCAERRGEGEGEVSALIPQPLGVLQLRLEGGQVEYRWAHSMHTCVFQACSWLDGLPLDGPMMSPLPLSLQAEHVPGPQEARQSADCTAPATRCCPTRGWCPNCA